MKEENPGNGNLIRASSKISFGCFQYPYYQSRSPVDQEIQARNFARQVDHATATGYPELIHTLPFAVQQHKFFVEHRLCKFDSSFINHRVGKHMNRVRILADQQDDGTKNRSSIHIYLFDPVIIFKGSGLVITKMVMTDN